MDEKLTMKARYARDVSVEEHGYGDVKQRRDPIGHRGRRALRNYLLLVFSIFFVVIYIIPKSIQIFSSNGSSQAEPQIQIMMKPNNTSLVPLEAHIMSKCPDAKDCLVDLVVPAMEQIVEKVDFRLSYIGSMAKDDTVQCMHGQTECLGNMLGLCAAELFPKDVKRSLGFSTCLIQSYDKIPARELVEHCSNEHGISFDDVNACVSDEGKGLELLEASVQRSQKAGVVKSCTVRVGGDIWCIRDGAQWKDCPEGHEVNDLVQAVNKRYEKSSAIPM